MSAETALLIGVFCGGMIGYAIGFLMARMIYRSKEWGK